MDARGSQQEVGVEERTVQRLLDEVERLRKTVRRLEAENERLRQRLAQYEPEVLREGMKTAPQEGPERKPLEYSVAAEERRRRTRRRKKKKSPGRRPTRLKFEAAQRIENVYPPAAAGDCHVVRERAVWRLEAGRAVLVGYRVFAAPGVAEPRLPGVTPRCEYGIEILVTLAYLVYVIGISLDKACAVLQFFCELPLSKSQADALLRQLAREWEAEFEALCVLLADAAVVYLDETGWKIGDQGCSLWTFASQAERVFLFGCRKDAATLDAILPPDVFQGIGVSDDAAVYRHRFPQAQKCWAHLLRKAIRLALLYPRKPKYQRFLDRLLALYYDAKRAAADGRLGEAGRLRRVAELEGRLCELCNPYWRDPTPDTPPHEREFLNLVNELLQRLLDEELFTFVRRPEVEPTNNLPERLHRDAAKDRKTGRTSQTAAGAKRRSVTVSVLESLRAVLPEFTLAAVLAEVQRWMSEGISRFGKQLESLGLSLPDPESRAEQWQALGIAQLAPNTS
jgi:hypothetical protein